jgi:hypothetical protein
MLPDTSSATAFAPLPPAVLYEPPRLRGVGTGLDPRLRRVRLQYSSSSLPIAELPLQLASEKAASALVEEKPVARPDRSEITELFERVQFLRVQAVIDRVPFSDSSLADFQDFMREISPRRRPSLFLNDNGNLRALWKNDRREQVGLQFLGEGDIQFVIFKERKGTLRMARIAGIDARDKILAHMKASGAEGLLFG